MLLLVCVVAALVAARARLPVQVAILGLGMLLGSDGPGGVAFDDAELARMVGVAGLAAILFEGGLTTRRRDLRPVLVTAALLATVGVAITGGLAGLAAWWAFDLTLQEALLVGAVVGSTDAAAVFATLRYTTLRPRLTGLLEAESGLNDPMAVALTVGLIAMIETSARGGWATLGVEVARHLATGLVIGAALAWPAARAVRRFPVDLVPFAPVASVGLAAVSFGVADVAGGSGFLAVYIVAVAVGNALPPQLDGVVAFHEGLAFLAQVVLFGVLGLLVFPTQLPPVIVPGLAVAAVLTVVARPAAVWVCTAGGRYSPRERVFLGWAGLRGAVPIVLATFALSADLAASEVIFHAVFFVVIASAVVQGPTLEPLARRLGLLQHPTPPPDAATVRRPRVVSAGRGR